MSLALDPASEAFRQMGRDDAFWGREPVGNLHWNCFYRFGRWEILEKLPRREAARREVEQATELIPEPVV